MIVSDGTTKSVSLDDLKHHTNKDPLLESVITSIKSNRWIKKTSSAKFEMNYPSQMTFYYGPTKLSYHLHYNTKS